MPVDVGRDCAAALDAPVRVLRRLGLAPRPDYRALLFEELKARLAAPPRRVLEIGPRDGEDTRRLLTLRPERLVLIDLPNQEAHVRGWLAGLDAPNVELLAGNFMHDPRVPALEPFDLIWCTGVLYHNPEQLRMVRRLFDLLVPGGLLVIESATARRPGLRNQSCVEIWHRVDKAEHRRRHVSTNVTHLPSRRALAAWLAMVGFEDVRQSRCHRRVLRTLAIDRAAVIARRGTGQGEVYHKLSGDGGYAIGRDA
jgi:SAM-dependent methyltransferase